MMAFGRDSEQDVGFRDRADAGMEDSHLHLVGAELGQHFAQGFLRSLDVALQNDRDFLDFAFRELAVQLIEGESRGLRHCGFAQLFLAVLRDLPCLFVVHALEGIASQRQALQSEDFDRSRRRRFLHRFAVLVEHGADLAVDGAGNEVVADLERSVLDEHGRDVAAALVDLGFQDDAR